jgi:predicted DNA-binding transcriptional regulator AlpA
VTLNEVCAATGLSKGTIPRLVAAAKFPRVAKRGKFQRNYWLASEVDEWMMSRAQRWLDGSERRPKKMSDDDICNLLASLSSN